jgi:hypothetical protein
MASLGSKIKKLSIDAGLVYGARECSLSGEIKEANVDYLRDNRRLESVGLPTLAANAIAKTLSGDTNESWASEAAANISQAAESTLQATRARRIRQASGMACTACSGVVVSEAGLMYCGKTVPENIVRLPQLAVA